MGMNWENLWKAINEEEGLCERTLRSGQGEVCSIGARCRSLLKELKMEDLEPTMMFGGIHITEALEKSRPEIRNFMERLKEEGIVHKFSVGDNGRYTPVWTSEAAAVVRQNDYFIPTESPKDRKERMLNWVCENIRKNKPAEEK